jgi:hypothetical protein
VSDGTHCGPVSRSKVRTCRARKGREYEGVYMPDGERTCVDDREESSVRTQKQRKEENGIIGHHDGINVRMSSHLVEVFWKKEDDGQT